MAEKESDIETKEPVKNIPGFSDSDSDSDEDFDEYEPLCYAKNPKWSDVVPVPQYDMSTLARVTCPIAYDDEYAEKKGYFRGLIAKLDRGEVTLSDPRFHEIAVDIIDDNPSEYTAWHYLRLYTTANALTLDEYRAELAFVDRVAEESPKNYQFWVYRESIIENILKRYPESVKREELATDELNWCAKLIKDDSKNYHAWDYRQWVIRYFATWNFELDYTEFLLDSDLRNNSAWTHRFFVLTHEAAAAAAAKKEEEEEEGKKVEEVKFPKEMVEREIAFAEKYIRKAPASNQSAWTFLAGVVERSESGRFADFPAVKKMCLEIEGSCPKSAYCVGMLVDIFDEEGNEVERVERINRLVTKLDPVRKNYWEYVLETPKYPKKK